MSRGGGIIDIGVDKGLIFILSGALEIEAGVSPTLTSPPRKVWSERNPAAA